MTAALQAEETDSTVRDLVKIWSFEHNAWWAPDSIGYTNNEAGAGLYDRKEAEEIVRQANRGGVVNEGIVEIEKPASKVTNPAPHSPLLDQVKSALNPYVARGDQTNAAIAALTAFEAYEASQKPKPCDEGFEEPVHRWFSLSYCAYAVIPRSIAQSMPVAWQRRFVRLMDQMNGLCVRAGISTPDYHVHGRENGKYVSDPYRDYQRGRRDVFADADTLLAKLDGKP